MTSTPPRIPFPVVDEVARHCLQEEEPETVHIEVHLPGRLDPTRLRKAFTEALHRHPRILMREAPGRWYRRRYEWELTTDPDVEVVTFPPPNRNALRAARTRALLEAPPLSLSPPIRLEVVEGTTHPEGSEATDAVGTHVSAATTDDGPSGTAASSHASGPRPTPAAATDPARAPSPAAAAGSRAAATAGPARPAATESHPHDTAASSRAAGPTPTPAAAGSRAAGQTPTPPTAADPARASAPATAPSSRAAGPTPTPAAAADPARAPSPAAAAGSRAAGAAPDPQRAAPRERGRAYPPPGGNAGDGKGTVLFLTINHTALDGPACLRILATAAELYGGKDNAPATPPVRPPEPPRDQPPTPSNWSRPARVAPGSPEPSPGNGLLVTELPLPHRPKGAPYTVNDQLMVTTALTIAHWNREHGADPRPLRITMPVDDRPRDTTMPMGNGTRLVEVPFAPTELAHPKMPDLLRRTATRTRALKSLPRPQLGHGAALLTAPVTPVAWRAALTRGLRRGAAPWTSTTLLSNIGRIPYPLDFGEEAGRAHAVWFSAPARMPRGLTVTTASTAGRLHLALRWSRALLGHGDGAHLRDLFEHYLHTTEAGA